MFHFDILLFIVQDQEQGGGRFCPLDGCCDFQMGDWGVNRDSWECLGEELSECGSIY